MDTSLAALAELAAQNLNGRHIAAAESFTAGLVGQSFACVEGSSDWFAGAVTTYQTEAKRTVLGVEADDVVSRDAAIQMATGAAKLFGVDVAIATTGVAGPDDQDGVPAGTVIVGWYVDGAVGAEVLRFSETSPEVVVHQGTHAALTRLAAQLALD